MPSSQTLVLGRHDAAVRSALARLDALHAIQRLWACDANLWTSDASVQARIRERFGWLTIATAMRPRLSDFTRVAQACRLAGYTHAVLLGMGGSSLFAEVCSRLLSVGPGGLDLAVLDTTDPTAIRQYLRRVPLERLLIIVSSKSGTTIEVTSLARYAEAEFAATRLPFGDHLIVITDTGTPLEAQAASWSARAAFYLEDGGGRDVGGRFSALTAFGLVPAALLGADVGRLLERGEQMARLCGADVPLQSHPAAQLAAVLGGLAAQGCNKMTLVCEPELAGIGAWIEQLVAESTGKAGQGIVPILDEALPLPASTPDRFIVSVRWTDARRSALEEPLRAARQAGVPLVDIRLDDPYDLGGEVLRWAMATSLAGCLLQVNPFDEPNVQESKDRTAALLTAWLSDGRFPDEPQGRDGTLVIDGAAGPECAERLSQFLRQARAGDYIALLSYLPRTDTLDRALQEMRTRLAAHGYPTVIGIGPRYLHSTGQLFKGGADQGVFLFVTAESSDDLPIPGQRYTFGTLKQAQALGDIGAMRQRGRRLLHLHLRGDLDRAAQRLARSIASPG
ncbi:MAG: hypothetical protein COV75_05365 [Candidatus Omnitrophica bacterium CG11_big_fil_rev_8_21_14_0_20_63_9]|nr:MAG: hypothetical protein COV75_05365 [Candidatus Omnitrophica bacterium CG11_big_fil_rev_8_21_14_0_20_63_9]